MSITEFMIDQLDVIKNEIISGISTDSFDSHEFIRLFAKRFEMNYVEFLCSYTKEPFRNVHAQIAKFLSEHQYDLKIKDDGTIQSPNVFGIVSQNEKWIKIK